MYGSVFVGRRRLSVNVRPSKVDGRDLHGHGILNTDGQFNSVVVKMVYKTVPYPSPRQKVSHYSQGLEDDT